jgi:class 3 adenylate cyclase/tetratricopeptide (TPR) repeat protein
LACPRCGADTRPGQKFCAECGLALGSTCPNCGAPYEGSPKFCAECGTTLSQASDQSSAAAVQAAGAPGAERRYVSVLFADLVGFTSMSEQQDPEAVRELLSRYFDVAREVIEGYGGSVEKFIGDAVMAVWGAPVAREDDAERAVRAALELVDRMAEMSFAGASMSLRAGVLSGEAAVSSGRTGEGMIAGDIVNTASRLQSVAPAGVVLVGEATQRATSAAIAYEPAGNHLLKGKTAPVEAWRALRVVARVGGEAREEGLEPPFVGRDEDLRLLKGQLHAAERERRLRVVGITGQAGLGKSRLVWELEKYLDGLAGPILYYWHQGRSPSYGKGVTYWALAEMVRRRARIAEGESESVTREKLRTTLDEFVPDADERRRLEPTLGALLGIDEADWDQREQLFSAWRTFLERIADKGPCVLVFEDLQWADGGLIDFIDHLLDWIRDRPMLIITLARPEILERRPNFGMGHRAFVSLHLEPLSDTAMRELLKGLVPALAEDDLDRIVARAEGVPLFAVETVRALVDGGHLVRTGNIYQPTGELPVLDVPPTLRALIASRLDALDAPDRALLQDAAVLGLVFGIPALSGVTGRPKEDVESRLRALSAKEMVALENDPRSPERGQYRFRQGLIREVAYATLARRERRGKHIAAARYFETLGDDALAGVLANHYLEAYAAAPEGDEGAAVAAQARVALRSAAERASRLHSHEQAMAYLEQALAVTFDDRDRVETRIQAAASAVAVGQLDNAEDHYRAALVWYEEHGETEPAAETAARLGQMLLYASRIDEAMEVLTRAVEQVSADDPTSARLFGEIARGHLFRDESELALSAVSRALESAEATGRRSMTTQLLITKSWALAGLRRPREATALLLGAMRMADDEGQLAARTRARFNLVGYMASDSPRAALQVARDGLTLAAEYGLTLNAANMAGNAGNCALLLGDFDEVMRLEQGVAEINAPMSVGIRGYAAIVAALRGDWEGVRQRMAIVDRATHGSTSPQDVTWIRYQQAMLAFAEGHLEDARRLARESRDAYFGADSPFAAVLATHIDILLADRAAIDEDRPFLAQNAVFFGTWLEHALHAVDAAALALDGRIEEARTAYRRAIDDWLAADERLDLALTLLERARLLGQDDTEAARGRDEARELFGAMGAGDLVDRIEAAAGSPGMPRAAAAAARSSELPEDAAAGTR